MLRIRCGVRNAVPADDPSAVRWWAPSIRHVTCCLFPLRHRPVTNPFRFRLKSALGAITCASDPSSFARRWCSSRASRERSSFGSRFIIKPQERPCVHGKFLFVGNEKLYIRGVTYGAFQPDADGREYQEPPRD